ncbi:unnamed protein product [Euphydryas editha]|uniref:Nuclear apoptosis-inducing factor 1 n=1 Tax=Euphydryas editha TaxID=104508 RepID=A0AAU9USJ7_EUPED|nr:unnamed protein product [Euphydryas editha]
MAVVWSNENTLTLIELYENSQLLWDTSHIRRPTRRPTNPKKKPGFALTSQFNTASGQILRHKEQLKLKWDNLKKAERKRAQLISKNNLQAEGGKPDVIPPDEILEKVAGLMGSVTVACESDPVAPHYDDEGTAGF